MKGVSPTGGTRVPALLPMQLLGFCRPPGQGRWKFSRPIGVLLLKPFAALQASGWPGVRSTSKLISIQPGRQVPVTMLTGSKHWLDVVHTPSVVGAPAVGVHVEAVRGGLPAERLVGDLHHGIGLVLVTTIFGKTSTAAPASEYVAACVCGESRNADSATVDPINVSFFIVSIALLLLSFPTAVTAVT